MRKSNSIFKTAFVSEAGAELANNDYFAYVEDDDFACYVLASGITDFETSEAAKEVVEHLILSFEEKPSMSKSTLLQYMNETNERLLNSTHSRRLKASVIMLVTDYEKFRYVAAGNVRLRMYRQGRFFLKSSDMSLANDLIEKGESYTPLDKHEERHNLYAYLGKKDFFKPFISKVQKLADADIISLYSQGLWEHVDEQEIDEVFAEASDKPQESVDFLEEILLSRQPENLKSYTVAAIFIDKIFRDPERERKRLLYIKIAVIIIIILIIVAIIFYILDRIYQDKVQDFESTMQQSQEFMANGNYKRAQEVSKKALDLAQELKRNEDVKNIQEDLMILDNIVQADIAYNEKNYSLAYEDYMNALKYSSGTDKEVRNYIQRRLHMIENRLDIQQFLLLGDYLFQNGEYDEAESLYLKAIERASTVHDNEGRNSATAALEKVYDKRAELRKDAEQKLDAKKQAALNDALKRGDDLLAAGDIEGAEKAYRDARNLSDNPADRTQTDAALNKINSARDDKLNNAVQAALKKGDDLLAAGDIDGAEKAYLDARNLSDNPEVRIQTNEGLGKVAEARDKKILEERTTAEERQKLFDDAVQTELKGDSAFESGDYASAQMYYMTAIEKFSNLSEEPKVKAIQNKFDASKSKETESHSQKADAEKAEENARNFYIEKNFAEAQAAATQAKQLYSELGMKSKVDEMDILLQQIAVDSMISDSLK